MDKEGNAFDYWFKLLPYEYICVYEPELAALLTEIIRRKRCILLNPPYTLLFQSKAILKILWDLFPNHPLLLETDTKYLAGKKCVEKRTFSREGNNIRVFDAERNVIDARHGEYAMYGKIYQAWADLPQDTEGRLYQAGVFFPMRPVAWASAAKKASSTTSRSLLDTMWKGRGDSSIAPVRNKVD